MTKKSDTPGLGKEITQTATRSTVAATLATLAGQRPEMIVAAALSQFIPFAAGLVFGVAWNHKKASAERWWAEVLRDLAAAEKTTPAEVEERIRARADEPDVRETIFRSLRALLDSVDDAAAVPLARLVAQYQHRKARPDAFFRGVAHLVSELSGQEFVDMAQLVGWARPCCRNGMVTLVAVDRDSSAGRNAEDWPRSPWRVLAFTSSKKLNQPDGELPGIGDPERLLFLLQNNGLARVSSHVGWFGIDPFRIDVTEANLDRLLPLLKSES